MKIIIDFDPINQKINNVTIHKVMADMTDVIVSETSETITALPGKIENWEVNTPIKKERKKKEVVTDDSLTVTVGENKLILTKKLVDLLKVKEGDRLAVMYKESKGFIEPFLGKSDLFAGANGNKLTKGLTVSFRGDQRESLLKYGSVFQIEDNLDGSVKLITDVKIEKKPQTIITDLPQDIQDILMSEDEELNLNESNFIL